MPALPSRGSLTETPLPRLLLALAGQRATGILELEVGRTRKSVQLHDGAPVSVASNLPSEGLALRLEGAGTISAVDRGRVDSLVEQKGCSEAAAVLSLRLIEPKVLFAELRDQIRNRLVGCFAWQDGDFGWQAGETPAAEVQALRSDPYPIVQAGLATHWPLERMLMDLSERSAMRTRPAPCLADTIRRLERDNALDAFLAGLGGGSSFGSLLTRAARSPSALAGAWILDATGSLEYTDAQSDAHEPGEARDDLQIEISVAGQAAAAATRGQAPAVTESTARAADAAETAGLCDEILSRHARLKDLDHYAVLGLDSSAKSSSIKKAYFQAAKRFHPDKLAHLGLDHIRTQAAELFARIADANAVLGDAEKRKAYDESLASGAEDIDLVSLAQAEAFFRKGEILLKMGDFFGATDLLRSAVEVFPEESAYQATLGYALYKQTPPDNELARKHLDLAIGINVENAEAHYWLGLVLKALGEHRHSADALARARSIDPSVG